MPHMIVTRNPKYESVVQAEVIKWCRAYEQVYPCLKRIYATQNENIMAYGDSKDRAKNAAIAKRRGMRNGVSDLFLPYPSGKWHGAYFELKRDSKGKLSQSEKEWFALVSKDYYCVVTHGFYETIAEIEAYIKGERE